VRAIDDERAAIDHAAIERHVEAVRVDGPAVAQQRRVAVSITLIVSSILFTT
jgi:hypothetical protein